MNAMCDTLGVTRGGYYRSLGRAPSASAVRRAELVGRIRAAHAASRGLYGSPRVTGELNAAGIAVSENTVARLMSRHAIRSKVARPRFRPPRTTDSNHPDPFGAQPARAGLRRRPPGPQVVRRHHVRPDRRGDALPGRGHRRVLPAGRRLGDGRPHAGGAVPGALDMAVLHRGRPAPGLVHHSDRGSQYACDAYRDRLDELGFAASMSRAGDCYDNAVMESFWGTLKQGLLYQQPNGRFASREQAKRMIFEYVEVYYNRQRRHSAIGFVSPDAFEASLN